MAIDISAFLYHSKLQQATLGEIFHADVHFIHSVDCIVFLFYGVDGKWAQQDILLTEMYSPN